MEPVNFDDITFNGGKVKEWGSERLFANDNRNKYRLFYREFDGLYDFVAIVLHGGDKDDESLYPPTVIFYGSTMQNIFGAFNIIHHMHVIHDTIDFPELYSNPYINEDRVVNSLFYTTGLSAVQDLIKMK